MSAWLRWPQYDYCAVAPAAAAAAAAHCCCHHHHHQHQLMLLLQQQHLVINLLTCFVTYDPGPARWP
jgi:hypothetical protein